MSENIIVIFHPTCENYSTITPVQTLLMSFAQTIQCDILIYYNFNYIIDKNYLQILYFTILKMLDLLKDLIIVNNISKSL